MRSLILIIGMFHLTAQAGMQIRLNPMYLPSGSEDGEATDATKGDKVTTTSLTHRLDLGWKFQLGNFGIPVGGSWYYAQGKSETVPFDGTASTTLKATTQSLGLWTGVELGGFDLDFIYYLSPKLKLQETGKSDINFRKGSGWELGAGYLFPLGSWVAIGPRYVYRSFSWDEKESAGTVESLDVRPEKRSESQFMLGIEFEIGRKSGGRF